MGVYLLPLLPLIGGPFFVLMNKKLSNTQNAKKMFLFIFFLVCSLIMGLRDQSVGVDTFQYVIHFNTYASKSWSEIFSSYSFEYSMEFGYIVLMKLFSLICDNYYFFQFCISTIYCFGIARFLYYSVDNIDDIIIACSVFLGIGVFFHPFNITREYVAIMLLANSWIFLMQKKIVKAWLFTLFAISIHFTSIVGLIAYLICFLGKKGKLIRWLPIISLIMLFSYKPILNWFVKIFPQYQKYHDYTANAQGVGLVRIVWLIVAIFSIIVIYNRKKVFDNIEKFIAVFCLFYVIANVIGLQFAYFERVGYYFIPFTMVLFSLIKKIFKDKLLLGIYNLGVFSCFIAFYLLTGFTTAQYQYSFFF